jgi:ribonuclease J
LAARDEFVFAALGGIGEIGMNLAVYGFGPAKTRQWIAVDCGITFGRPELPGIDVIFPDIAFLEELGPRLLAMVITHAHEDHYGALAALWPRLRVPVYMSAFTEGLLHAKHGAEAPNPDMSINRIAAGSRWSVGPFDIEAIAVAHSIPEAMALAIRTPAGTAIHTGDWKLDDEPQIGPPTDDARLRAIGEEGVLALVCDSTNAVRDGRSVSEGTVAAEIASIVAEAKGRVAFTLFSSNAARLRTIAMAARAAGREVVASGRAIRRVIDVATELGYLDGAPPFREIDDLEHLPAANVVLILSGSQGETRAALARVASGEDRRVKLGQGDTMVFSSKPIPGNERAVIDIINQLVAAGVKVVTDHDRTVHASGHPRRGELTELYSWLKPGILLPVHGEAVHLAAQRELGRAAGIPTILEAVDGDLVRFAPDPAVIPKAVPVGRLYRDGAVIGLPDEVGVRMRRRMSFGGHVAIVLALDAKGDVRGGPEAVLTGIPEHGATGTAMVEVVEQAIRAAIAGMPRARRRDRDAIEQAIRHAVRGDVAEHWGKKPVCVVQVIEV